MKEELVKDPIRRNAIVRLRLILAVIILLRVGK